MHFKIMILCSDERHQRLIHCAETMLHEIAGSFGHKFSLRYEKIGQLSLSAYDTDLTEETVEACRECHAVFMDNGETTGADDLLDALSLQLSLRFCGIPAGMQEYSPFDLWVAKVRSLDAASIKQAMHQGFIVAEKMVVSVSQIHPNGNSCELWNSEFQKNASLYPMIPNNVHTLKSAAQAIIKSPETLGVFLTPPYAGNIYLPVAHTMCKTAYAVYDMALGKEYAVYSAVHEEENVTSLSIVGYAMAISAMLRITFNLIRESDCLDSALRNVLEYGWRTPDMLPTDENKVITPEEMTDLICEQISLAGQLMQDVGEMLS